MVLVCFTNVYFVAFTRNGVRSVFKSNKTIRSHLVHPKDPVDPRKQDGVVYKIPCECGKV